MGFSQSLFTFLFLSIACTQARLLQSISAVENESYDFIVVGAGTAGCVIASRLTESPSTKVLVIEAGITKDTIDFDENIPIFGPALAPGKPWTWNFTVSAQTALNNRTFAYPRGKLLGGSSSVNYMVYNRGGKDDYDRWAAVTGDSGWSWNSMQPFMKKNEKLSAPADNHNTTGQFISSAHGLNGTLRTSLPGFPTDLDNRVLAATQQVSGFPFNEDMNKGDETGIGWVYGSIADSKRVNSFDAYLAPYILSRPNLDVLIETQVTKVVNTAKKGQLPVFNAVEFSQGPHDQAYTLTACKEVILSAGTVGTPQLLLLSGIGDRSELKAVGISATVDLPDVGKNLQDHALLPNQFFVNSNNTWEARRDPAVLEAQLTQYNETGSGPLVVTVCNHIGWFRVPDNSSIWDGVTDPSAGPTAGQYELIFSNGFIAPVQALPSIGNFFTILTNLVSPASRGFVKLRTKSPWDDPIIDPALLTEPIDFLIMREAYKSARTFAAAPAFDGYIIEPFGTAGATLDVDIDAYIRNFTSTVWHPVGTAAMSSPLSKDGVTTPELLVKGVSRLRIADASVMPFIPSAHTEAPTYYVAERAADLIKSAWDLK